MLGANNRLLLLAPSVGECLLFGMNWNLCGEFVILLQII